MPATLPTDRRTATLAIVAAAGLLASGCAAGAAGAEPVSSVLATGSAEDRVQLPAPFAVGQASLLDGQMVIEVAIDGGGMSESLGITMELAIASEVTEVDEDGGAIVHNRIEEITVTDAPADVPTDTFENAVGVTLVEERSARGVIESTEVLDDPSLTSEQRAAAEELLSGGVDAANLAFPDEPVGVGARWTESQTVASSGIDVPVVFEYELVELTEESYVVELIVDSDIDTDVDGAAVLGGYTGGGRITGSLDNPLAVTTDMQLDGNFDVDDGDQSLSLSVGLGIQLTATEGSAALPKRTSG